MSATGGRKARLEALRRIEIFSDCSTEELESIDSLGTELSVRPGRCLTKEGQGGLEFFIINQGRAAVSRAGRLIGSLEPGAFFGEMALLGRVLRTATVTAETAMNVTLLHAGEFASLMAVAPSVRSKIMHAAKDRAGKAARVAGQPIGIARKLAGVMPKPA